MCRDRVVRRLGEGIVLRHRKDRRGFSGFFIKATSLAMQGLAAATGLRKEQPPKPAASTPAAPEAPAALEDIRRRITSPVKGRLRFTPKQSTPPRSALDALLKEHRDMEEEKR
jgi:hypothetical protein